MPDETPHARPWHEGRPPEGSRGWTWSPRGLEALPQVRHELRHHISTAYEGVVAPDLDSVHDIVMALDELMSNALRHGRAPVEVEVRPTDEGFLLLVSDRASEIPLQPTATRDPALGGMGLGIVANTSTASGWFSQRDEKVVWAVMPPHVS